MFASKEAVLLEVYNLRVALAETLRYRYVADRAADYYRECQERLNALEALIERSNTKDKLSQLWIQVGNLSDLISRIERSHVEEYPWPFVHALVDTCKEICRSSESESDPLFFFMAEGGASANYAVRLEDDEYDVMGRKIYSVIFPRTLRDHVLLHAIFGHEMMHAAIFNRQEDFRDIIGTLIVGSPLENADSLFSWCKKNISVVNKISNEFVDEQIEAWACEFLCDIFGLIIMGPAFLPAFQTILGPGSHVAAPGYVPTHPPFDSRMHCLLAAAEELDLVYSDRKYDSLAGLTKSLDTAFKKDVAECRPEFAILQRGAVREAAKALEKLARGFEKLPFPEPKLDRFNGLVAALVKNVPPVSAGGPSGSGIKKPELIDFRHILHAGWIRWSQIRNEKVEKDDKKDIIPSQFQRLNQFCAHAILQQAGIGWANAEHDIQVKRNKV